MKRWINNRLLLHYLICPYIHTGWRMKWKWRAEVEHNAKPQYLRLCWTFLFYTFLHQLRKQLSRIFFRIQEKFGGNLASAFNSNWCFTFCMQNQEGELCRVVNKSQEELCSKKVEHHPSFLNKEGNPRKTSCSADFTNWNHNLVADEK